MLITRLNCNVMAYLSLLTKNVHVRTLLLLAQDTFLYKQFDIKDVPYEFSFVARDKIEYGNYQEKILDKQTGVEKRMMCIVHRSAKERGRGKP